MHLLAWDIVKRRNCVTVILDLPYAHMGSMQVIENALLLKILESISRNLEKDSKKYGRNFSLV